MATLQVKGMDNQIYETLRRRAEIDNRSISQEVISIIQDYLSRPVKQTEKATQEFLKLSAKWKSKKSADTLITEIRSSRKRSNNTKDTLKNVFN